MNASVVVEELRGAANPAKAIVLQRFFKTGKREYAEGDVFLGVTVPQQRRIAKKYAHLSLGEIKKLLESPLHECRLTALLLLVGQYVRLDTSGKKKIVDFYVRNRRHVNNWDLVDSSAPHILGNYFAHDRSRSIFRKLALSRTLWDRRIAIVATLAMIRKKRFDMTLYMAELLLNDTHDLIHKAVGWMLREMGKQDEGELTRFLEMHAARMPRTMLRYAIERYPAKRRTHYLSVH